VEHHELPKSHHRFIVNFQEEWGKVLRAGGEEGVTPENRRLLLERITKIMAVDTPAKSARDIIRANPPAVGGCVTCGRGPSAHQEGTKNTHDTAEFDVKGESLFAGKFEVPAGEADNGVGDDGRYDSVAEIEKVDGEVGIAREQNSAEKQNGHFCNEYNPGEHNRANLPNNPEKPRRNSSVLPNLFAGCLGKPRRSSKADPRNAGKSRSSSKQSRNSYIPGGWDSAPSPNETEPETDEDNGYLKVPGDEEYVFRAVDICV